MDLGRFMRHAWMSPLKSARCFPQSTLDAIQHAVAAGEARHRGEIAFVVEAELGARQLWAGMTSRARAKEVFALHGVWNTEENSGVLIYLLLAERRVEIVADRGIDRLVAPGDWDAICRMMEAHFRAGRFEEGSLAGVAAVNDLLERHFPATGGPRNELVNRPFTI